MNSSYKGLEDFISVAVPLVKVICREIINSGVNSMKVLFGDNYRFVNELKW